MNKGTSNVANNLIDKLASGIGWIVSKDTPRKIAINTYIEEIESGNYDSLTKAALISQAKKTIKEYCNQKNIVEIAVDCLQKEDRLEKLDDDWIALFMDKARLVSDKEFQRIWGKVLATECDSNSIPKSLLYTLAQMDREDAETFTTLCSLAVKVDDEYQPIIDCKEFEKYKKWELTYSKIANLSTLGLVEMDFGVFAVGYEIHSEKQPIKVSYFEFSYEINRDSLSVGNVIFTKAGQALCKAILAVKKEGFWEELCLPMWEKIENIDES